MLDFQYDNAFVRELPGDPVHGPRVREVLQAWSPVLPTPVADPALLAYSREMAARLGLDEEDVRSEPFAQVFGGNRLAPGMQPFAANYGGHQFGHWAGQLGDGRAISLGEVVNGAGERGELQLKGAGRTPYSRGADGRAVLRSSIREFVCSEAMHHLGIPTTRALAVLTTGEEVMRDMFYDGHPAPEPGAVVVRVAPDPEGVRVDMRSASLSAPHDFGANGRHIESFLAELDEAVTVLLRDSPDIEPADEAGPDDLPDVPTN